MFTLSGFVAVCPIWKGVVSGDEPAIVLPEDVCEDDESL